MSQKREVFISVDVETSGPIPAEYSLLTVGACVVLAPELTFEASVKPISSKADPKALEVTGLSMQRLAAEGEAPEEAMRRFAEWIAQVSGNDGVAVFVGFNAPFDWSFVNYYFHRYYGSNPFGFSALDIKSFYMGATDCSWEQTKSSHIEKQLKPKARGDHNALHDALYQAELFRLAMKSERLK